MYSNRVEEQQLLSPQLGTALNLNDFLRSCKQDMRREKLETGQNECAWAKLQFFTVTGTAAECEINQEKAGRTILPPW